MPYHDSRLFVSFLYIASCRPDQFVCRDYSCVSTHARCDGSIHCPDGSDENQCGKAKNPIMQRFTYSKQLIINLL